MIKKEYTKICDGITGISPYIRFVGIVGRGGELLAYKRRPDLKPLLNAKNTQYQFSHIAIKTDLEGFFDENLGEIEFVWEERKKVQTISFAIKKVKDCSDFFYIVKYVLINLSLSVFFYN